MKGKKLMAGFAFFATVVIAFVLMFRAIFQSNTNVGNALMLTGEIIAFAITMIEAFYFVKAKKHIAWKIVYAVAVTAIIALLVVVNL
ncbi:MAG: hypothetical protein J5779_03410 [Clostridia bacterium]|nr:hypothetical protein [Clostridia bacterium]